VLVCRYDPAANNKRAATLTRFTDLKMIAQPGSRVFTDIKDATPLTF
jgi:hypothetical protein